MSDLGVEGLLILPFDRSERPSHPENREQQRAADGVLPDIYDRYVGQVYKFIFHKVGNREDAEDLTSQVFLKAAQNLDTGHDEKSILAWLFQVARTTIADHWRLHYRSVTVSLDEMSEDGAAQPSVQLPALPQQDGSVAEVQVQTILAALPQNYRRVLELRFLHGFSLKETAAAMSISEGNVKVLQYRALQKAARLEINMVKL